MAISTSTQVTAVFPDSSLQNFSFHVRYFFPPLQNEVISVHLDDWLTVHRSITLVNFQLYAQNSYLFIYKTFIKILYMFRALPC